MGCLRMRLTRVFVDAALAAGATVTLPDLAAGHLVRVLRLGVGDACVLFNGDGSDYAARIVTAGKRAASVQIDSATAVNTESSLRITLVQALARGQKMDWSLQKATELGVCGFVPVASERAEVRLQGERADKRVAHWHSVVVSACEQSGRAWIPALLPPAALADALAALAAGSLRIVLDPEAPASLASLSPQTDEAIVVAIGPEGGWSPDDLAALDANGFLRVQLGPRVLRTETAGLAAIAALQARFGDFCVADSAHD